MWRFGIGMRWWLALAFALVVGLTALAVALVFTRRTESAFRERTTELAAGNAVAAAEAVRVALERDELASELPAIALRRSLSLFVFSGEGELLSPDRSGLVTISDVPGHEDALSTALADRRYVQTLDDGTTNVIALPLNVAGGGVLIAYVPLPAYAASVGILRREIGIAALVAIPVGAAAGMLIAVLIASRLRRIAAAATAIESGRFDAVLAPRFRDEVGSLAATIDSMRVQLEESFATLAAERDRLERLLERLHEGVVMVDRDLRVEYANETARHLLGTPSLTEGDDLPEPWVDAPLRELAGGLFRPGARLAQARAVVDDEHVRAIVGIPAAGALGSALLVLTDVSEQERRERAEREFVTNAAHELRTPLTAISGAIEVLQAGAKYEPESRDRFLGHIERESARLARLARALLVLARAQTGQQLPHAAPVVLAPVLDEVAAGLAPSEGVSVEVSCPPELAVSGDRDLVEQIVANLAGNAIRHTQAGTVKLAAANLGGGSTAIEVRDTGPGVTPADQERIFDRFYRGDGDGRDAGGFGLGLAIVRESVRALGGRIELESAPGAGTVVRVVLPAAHPFLRQ